MPESELPNKELFDVTSDAVFVIEIEEPNQGRILDANNAAAIMHGYTREELLTMRIGELDTPEGASHVSERLNRLRSEKSLRFEVEHLRKDGTQFWVEVTAGLVNFHGRQCVVAFNRDISERIMTQTALQESEERWKFAIEGSGVGLWDCDIPAGVSYFSSRWKEILGYDETELSNDVSEWEKRVHPEDWPRVIASVHRHLEGASKYYQSEHRVYCKDRNIKWVLDRGLVVRRDSNGKPLRMIGTFSDITERKLAERRLIESEERYRTLVEWTSEAVLVHRGAEVLFANPAAVRLFGASRLEELVGYPIDQLIHPDFRSLTLQRQANIFNGMEEPMIEERLLRLDGAPIDVEIRSSKIGFDGLPAIYTSIRDISARIENERALRESETQLKNALEATRDGLWDWDLATDSLHLSPQWARLLGYNLNEFPHDISFFFHVLHPDDHQKVKHALEDHFAGRTPVKQNEVRLRTKTGEYRWFLDRGKVVARDSDGRPNRMIGTITDITELRESQLRAEAASRSKSEFLANMSHEIRTPLTAILGFADLLLDEKSGEFAMEQRIATVETIKNAGSHLLTIINDILDLSKIEADKMAIECIETPLVEIVREVVSLMRPRAIGKGLIVEAHLTTPTPERALTDPTRFRQVLMNLIGNAIKFTEAGSIVVATGAQLGGSQSWLTVDIEDTGIGMSQDHAERLFLPFGQADASVTRSHGGTGLGLTISRRLANLMGGDVELVRTEVGKGSRFRLRIPIVAVGGARIIHQIDETLKWPPSSPSGVPVSLFGRILLAEDGIDNQRLIAFHLNKAGAKVDIAENGRIALEMIEKLQATGEKYDLLVTDVQMPEMDGHALARELRQRGSRIPIIALTAHAMTDDRQRCLDAGCNAYQSKPIDKLQLLSTCAEWLRGTG
ncbi:MAG: PAS domain S-box protein [Planctomycetota bacterium]|nr:PAS domain S-box protein [Planctomycetota bacterium]